MTWHMLESIQDLNFKFVIIGFAKMSIKSRILQLSMALKIDDFLKDISKSYGQGDCSDETWRAYQILISAQNGPFGQQGQY